MASPEAAGNLLAQPVGVDHQQVKPPAASASIGHCIRGLPRTSSRGLGVVSVSGPHALAAAGGQHHARTGGTALRSLRSRSSCDPAALQRVAFAVQGLNSASRRSISACALAEWSPPKLHTYTSSVTPRCSGQVWMHRCDSASSTVAVTPPGPSAWPEIRGPAAHGLQAGGGTAFRQTFAQRSVVGEPLKAALAVVEVGGEVQPLHGAQL
jgi:hypothetical protein